MNLQAAQGTCLFGLVVSVFVQQPENEFKMPTAVVVQGRLLAVRY